MSLLSVLIPPFLMCAVVIVAIVAFLRHEMGRARTQRPRADDDNSAPVPTPPDKHVDHAGSDADTSASARRDG
jgi:hypothetical protein